MKKIIIPVLAILALINLCAASFSSLSSFLLINERGFCDSEEEGDQFHSTRTMTTLGGLKESHSSSVNSAEIDSLVQFAIQEHNKKENALLEFVRVVKAQEQGVAGKLHHLTVEAVDAGKKKFYEAKVWVKPWMNFKELQEFKHVGDAPSCTSSDLGVKKDAHGPAWQAVPAHDPVVQDAANHAVKTLHQRSNSLFPYELQEIADAKAEVVDEYAKINMVIKVKRGDKEEKFKVEVHKKDEGSFHLNQIEPHTHQD